MHKNPGMGRDIDPHKFPVEKLHATKKLYNVPVASDGSVVPVLISTSQGCHASDNGTAHAALVGCTTGSWGKGLASQTSRLVGRTCFTKTASLEPSLCAGTPRAKKNRRQRGLRIRQLPDSAQPSAGLSIPCHWPPQSTPCPYFFDVTSSNNKMAIIGEPLHTLANFSDRKTTKQIHTASNTPRT